MRIEQIAIERGYRVDESGKLFNPKNVEIGTVKENGYVETRLRVGDRSGVRLRVHRLQAFQKFGMRLYDKYVVVRHLNGDRKDNSIDNIEIGTHRDNVMDRSYEERLEHAKHASSFTRIHDHDSIKSFYLNNGKSYEKTMEEFGISSKGTLHFILNK